MVGRVAKVSYETIFEVLKGMSIFNSDGILKRKTDPVWKEACRILKDINLQNLYIFVQQDRKHIKTNLMKHLNIDFTPSKPRKMKKNEPKAKYHEKWDDYEFYETLDNEQETTNNDLNTLILMMDKEEYKITIQKFKLIPFSIIYLHPEQITVWKDLINIESTVSLIVLDNIVTNISENFVSGNIFLYALAVELKSSVILLAQMISSSTDSLEVEFFLNIWLQNNAPAPSELIIGYSYSLLDAASLVFNFCTFDDYNLRCYKCLINEMSELPHTLIQIDIIGLIKVVDGWTCFKDILQPVKDLYLCSIMYLSTVDGFDEFKETVKTILILCQSPYKNTEIEARKAVLWNNLTTDTIQKMNQSYIQYVTGKNGSRSYSFLNLRENPIIEKSVHEIYNCINQLKLQAFEMCDFNMEPEKEANDYYCPIILENLIQLFIEFPSWTKVIFKKDDCSSLVSSCSTRHLSTLREIIEPLKPLQFLIYHLEKTKALSQLGMIYFNDSVRNRANFVKKELKNNHVHLIQNAFEQDYEHNNELGTNVSYNETGVLQREELNLIAFKANIYSAINSLIDFDDCVQNILNLQFTQEQQMMICKTFLDCCIEMKTYKKFLGTVTERFCLSSEAFSDSLREILIDCYNTIELYDKNKLKDTSKLFAHLLISDSISWEILSHIKLNEKDVTSIKINFIRILLKEMAENLGITKLIERFQNKTYRPAFRGLFPMENTKDMNFASTFFKSIGLKTLCVLLKKNQAANDESKYSLDISNTTTKELDSQSDFIIELRISKNLNNSGIGKKKIILIN